jgi:succinate dehydrogenase / fumarate reductase flavoprotein subunit
MYEQFMELARVDITKEPMEVGPTAHYMMGGVRVDAETAASTVPGLYAAGEVAGGMHGANRLGGNSLSDLLVFGRRAGAAAAACARGLGDLPALPGADIEAAERELLAPFDRTQGENPYEVHQALQKTMQNLVGIFRTETDLRRGIEEIASLRARAARVRVEGSRLFNPGWHLARDLHCMLEVSEGIARAALLRTESRGAHSRLDHPRTDDTLGRVNVCMRREGGQLKVATTPLPEMPADLRLIVEQA